MNGEFMPEMHLRQPGFTYSACGPFTKNKERIQKFEETGDSWHIHQNELDKACFQHDMAYGDFKYLARRTASDKVLCGKAFNIATNLNYDRYQRGLVWLQWFINSLIKRTSGSGIKNENMPDQQLAEELHKPIIRKFRKIKIPVTFYRYFGCQLTDMQLISKFNKGFRLSLCVIDIYSKYPWVIPLKENKKYYNYQCFSRNFKRI